MDLEDAVTALENFDRGTDKSKVDKYVALGLLANVYLVRGEAGDYQKAADAAGKVIASGKFPLMTASEVLESGFRSIAIGSWMWGIDLTAENTPGENSFYGHVDYFTYGRCSRGSIKVMDEDLYATIPWSDVRRQQFGAPTTNTIGSAPLAPIYKFYDAERKPGGDKLYTNDLLYMRSEEMYLIRTEALARLGKNEDAKIALKALLSLRDNTAAENLNDLTNAELLETIWYNWRVEMWGEGKTYFAMKRFKKTMHRTALPNNHVYHAGKSFPYNYERMIFEIPEYERVNNPKLGVQQ
jgi:hypothetical protein